MRHLFRLCFLLGFFITAFTPTHNAQAATFSVCTLAELTTAITTANANSEDDTINFNCSTTLIFTVDLPIEADGGNDITINSNGNTVIFDGVNATRFFTVNAGASLTLDGFTLEDGLSGEGGTIYNTGTLTINNSTFTDNTATIRGGVIFSAGTLTISNSTFTSNSAGNAGGAIFSTGTLTISNSTLSGNSATDLAGAIINNAGSLTISDSILSGNSASGDGGAIYTVGGTVTISNSTLSGNSTTTFGGAIFNSSTLTISNSTLSGNSADSGGGMIFSDGTVTITNSTLSDNSTGSNGGAILNFGTVNSQDTHYAGDATNNTCFGTITDNGGNTRVNSAGCPGSTPITLDVSALTCNGDDAVFTINAGDANFDITDTTAGVSITDSPAGLITLTGPDTWTNVTVTERRGERQFINIGGISCPDAIIIPPTPPTEPTVTPTVTVLGCVFDAPTGVEIANAPDNTYCRLLMRNGGVVDYSGAIPRDLIGLGVKLAVDVYRLEGGMSINTFPDYARICLSGTGRYFYMDGRNAPRFSVEMPTEQVDGLTCAWIPAPGTVILTN